MRVRVRFSGRVQGVGFRATVCSIAAGHAVTGWVRNEADGSVVAEVQGEPAAVNAMLDEVRGERAGYIRGEDRTPMDEVPAETGFQIRR